MIEAQSLTKTYGVTRALKGVSFSIQPGEVVGLLGPNGAGKTTLLKILTGYLPPTEGSARVANLDVLTQSLDVRRRIGYLPETNPLYEELAVYESLLWTARLRGMEKNETESALRHVIGVCGLGSVVGKDIAHLSKGFRQRVGLAQAILHDPEILILDEPTSGLDPNQQAEVRQLIQTLKQKKTVLLSTHILSEAQSSCDRVFIIHEGQIVADGTPQSLSSQFAGVHKLIVTLKGPEASVQTTLGSLPGVTRVSVERKTSTEISLSLELAPGADVREQVFDVAKSNGWPILHLAEETISLEDVFRQLTLTPEVKA